jgi:hypothetical protein
MDARRFDSIVRGVARVGSRRSLLRSLAIATGSTIATASIARADSDLDGVGGSDASTVCPPSRRPARKVTGVAPFPSFVVGGSCDNLDNSRSYNLIDAGSEDSGDDAQGEANAIRVARSMTTIRVRLEDLLDAPHSIVIRAGGSNKEMIACGEIGGVYKNNAVAQGLKERNGSGYAGVAQLRGSDDQTSIDIFLAQDLFELVDSWEGAIVTTTVGVNLRKSPSEDGEIVDVLEEGTVLTVTGSEQGGWLPVKNEATGESGYVSAEYVQIQ